MTTANDSAPPLLMSVDRADPGDEVFRRFRYQATHAATIAVELLDEHGDVEEIYCEHHEDILLRLRSGRFRGVQVKTRQDGGQPLRATDDAVLDSLVRFVELDLAHPQVFEEFQLVTNGSFDRTGKSHGNLHAVIDEALARLADPTASAPKALRLAKAVVQRLKKKLGTRTKRAKGQIPKLDPRPLGPLAASRLPTDDEVLACLSRVSASDALPKLPDIRSRLRDRLVERSPKVRASTLPAANRVVDALEYAAYKASSRADEDKTGRYWFVSDMARRAQLSITAEIEAKCLSRTTVTAAIEEHCAGGLLVSLDPVRAGDPPHDLSTLERKLVLGGLSNATISVARDAVASVEELGLQMYYRDESEGLRRYNHTRAIAKKEAALAYEGQAAGGSVSGPMMLTDIEKRLKTRRAEDKTGILAECEEEHLLGHVFSLTSECVVWWSTSRDLGDTPDAATGEGSNG